MLPRRLHLQFGKDVKPAAGTTDRFVERDVLGYLAALAVDADICRVACGGHAVEAETAERGPDFDGRKVPRQFKLAGEDFAKFRRFEGTGGGALPDPVPAIVRAPGIMAQRPDVVVFRRGTGEDARAVGGGVEPACRLPVAVDVQRRRQDVIEVGNDEVVVAGPGGRANLVEAGVAGLCNSRRPQRQALLEKAQVEDLSLPSPVEPLTNQG